MMTAKFHMIVVGIAVVRGTRPSQLVYHLFHHLDRLLLGFVAVRVICQRNGRASAVRSINPVIFTNRCLACIPMLHL